MAILTNKPAAWASYRRNMPAGFSAITDKEAKKNPVILSEARAFINAQVKANAPLGTKVIKKVGNDTVCYIVEPHYHAPNGPVKPWGWHKGCTVFVQKGAVGMGLTPAEIASGGLIARPSSMAGDDFGGCHGEGETGYRPPGAQKSSKTFENVDAFRQSDRLARVRAGDPRAQMQFLTGLRKKKPKTTISG